MRMGAWFGVVVVAVVVAVGAVVATPLGVRPLQAMFPPGEIEPVDFKTVTLNNQPARYLVCPEVDACPELNDRTPIFDVSLERLQSTLEELIFAEPGVELVLADDGTLQYTYLKRSGFLQIPDLITIQYFDLSDSDVERSTVILYSRRVYVSGDFGENSQRILRYMDGLESQLGIYRR